nr:PREDICTED: uncharacterized protein LOC105668938 [Linepithema humile]
MSSLDDLLTRQDANIVQLSRALPNLKKLGVNNFTISKVKNRLAALEKVWGELRDTNFQLLHFASEEDKGQLEYFTRNVFFRAEEIYLEASDYMTEAIGSLDHAVSSRTISGDASAINSTIANISATRLRRIELLEFSGDRLDWEHFRDMFESLVINDLSLTNVMRLHHLKASLKGNAALLLRHFKITESNFESAWKALTDEFAKTRLIINSHLHAIAELPILKNETASALRNLRNVVKSSVDALSNLGRPVDKWDDLLIFILVKKSRIYSNTSRVADGVRRHLIDESRKCPACSESHLLFRCKQFFPLNADQRFALVKKLKCCVNCLRLGHATTACTNSRKCYKCDKPHHTSLHRDNKRFETNANSEDNSANTADVNKPIAGPSVLTASTGAPRNYATVLLATAWVKLRTPDDRTVRVRALLNQGSTHLFISETLAQNLRTPRQRMALPVTCFGEQYSGTAKSMVNLAVESCKSNDPSLPVTAYVFNKITSYSTSKRSSVSKWPHLRDLADRSSIQLLIGADIYGAVLLEGLRKGPLGSPTAQCTIFGWIVTGPVNETDAQASVCAASVNSTSVDLDKLLVRFWETEEVPSKSILTADEESCETHFRTTHSREESGRYIVRFPFKQSPPPIGESLSIASCLYGKLERRLSRDPYLVLEYNSFLQKYRDLGHMELIPATELSCSSVVYLPHYPVRKKDGLTTKIRVVFNASCNTSNQTSLNDHLFVGPKLQTNLPTILMRWRQHKFVYILDIVKMFRQIFMHPADRDYQRIPGDLLRNLQFSRTVYVRLRGFRLRKWAANHDAMLEDVPQEDRAVTSKYPLEEESSIKVLGISWSPRNDSFKFKVSLPPSAASTKRSVLSTIARVFDLLGWATPVVIVAKILMQELWIRKCDWDDHLREDLNERPWELSLICELLTYFNADVKVVLIAAKSKVAPIKTFSIPRLELNAAVLLVRLFRYVTKTMPLINVPTYCWTDSTIVLEWLKKHPSTWTTFVANRWWTGPTWLRESPTSWPISACRIHEEMGELDRKIAAEHRKAVVTHAEVRPNLLALNDLPNRMSSWTRLLRVTANRERIIDDISPYRNSSDLGTQLATDGTSWHFIPPAAPHFGGIWEAGVKSMKHHLRRVVGNHTLSSDEFATLLCQIEACLNSRPISALTADLEDFATLIPGHFLIGAPLAAVPEESVLELQENRLSRYQRVQAMLEHFWQTTMFCTMSTVNNQINKQQSAKKLQLPNEYVVSLATSLNLIVILLN